MYFADLSFLVASLVFDISTALRMKIDIVKDFVSSGNRNLLDEALQKVSDFHSPLNQDR